MVESRYRNSDQPRLPNRELIKLFVACTIHGLPGPLFNCSAKGFWGLWLPQVFVTGSTTLSCCINCSSPQSSSEGSSSSSNQDAEKQLALSPFFGKFNSMKMVGKKGSVAVIEYKLIEKGTSNFRESNILSEGGFGCVYRARLDDNLIVAVKKLDCATEDAEKGFEIKKFKASKGSRL